MKLIDGVPGQSQLAAQREPLIILVVGLRKCTGGGVGFVQVIEVKKVEVCAKSREQIDGLRQRLLKAKFAHRTLIDVAITRFIEDRVKGARGNTHIAVCVVPLKGQRPKPGAAR